MLLKEPHLLAVVQQPSDCVEGRASCLQLSNSWLVMLQEQREGEQEEDLEVIHGPGSRVEQVLGLFWDILSSLSSVCAGLKVSSSAYPHVRPSCVCRFSLAANRQDFLSIFMFVHSDFLSLSLEAPSSFPSVCLSTWLPFFLFKCVCILKIRYAKCNFCSLSGLFGTCPGPPQKEVGNDTGF